jgi:hypothetical protein
MHCAFFMRLRVIPAALVIGSTTVCFEIIDDADCKVPPRPAPLAGR